MAREVVQGEHVGDLDLGDQGAGLKSQLPGSLHHGIHAGLIILSPQERDDDRVDVAVELARLVDIRIVRLSLRGDSMGLNRWMSVLWTFIHHIAGISRRISWLSLGLGASFKSGGSGGP